MTPAEQLAALRRRTPDSIAPNGDPLQFVRRCVHDLSENEKDVLVERATGWENASCGDLAAIFCTTPQTISFVVRNHKPKSGTISHDLSEDGPAGAQGSHDLRPTQLQRQTRDNALGRQANLNSISSHGER